MGTGGLVFHVLNRGVRRMRLFDRDGDYRDFLEIFSAAQRRTPMRCLAYCLMPNHFHLVLWPRHDGDLSQFMFWLTTAHSKRWHGCHGTSGTGHVYQGRFKSLPVGRRRALPAAVSLRRTESAAGGIGRKRARSGRGRAYSSVSGTRGLSRCLTGRCRGRTVGSNSLNSFRQKRLRRLRLAKSALLFGGTRRSDQICGGNCSLGGSPSTRG